MTCLRTACRLLPARLIAQRNQLIALTQVPQHRIHRPALRNGTSPASSHAMHLRHQGLRERLLGNFLDVMAV